MKQHRRRFILTILLIALGMQLGQSASSAQPAGTRRVYLPMLVSPQAQNVFGLEMEFLLPQRGLDLLLSSGTSWVRRNALYWNDVEPVEGQGYNWEAASVKRLEREMLSASQANLRLILIVRASPGWATKPSTATCGPINPAKYAAFARFLAAAAARYSQPPYNVRYWEIGNEPDAPITTGNPPFGCWGDVSDPYYGGEAYGTMLTVAAPALKAVSPEIQILNGGLLLDRAYKEGDPRTLSGRFFEGMLRAGAGPFIDVVSFHSYTYYDPGTAQPLGPKQDWRVAYLRGLLARYKLPEKPLLRTEAALLCVTVNPECRWAQADFVARVFAHAIRDNLAGSVWYVYNSDSYHNTALIEPQDVFVPRPAYFAYRNAAELMSGAEYIGPLSGQPASVEGYRLRRRSGETLIVFWANQFATVDLAVANDQRATCLDRDGGALTCAPVAGRLRLSASQSPTFVLLP